MGDKGGKRKEEDNENEEIDETNLLIVDVNIDEDGIASIHKSSVASSSRTSRNSFRARKQRRKKQVSLPLHDAFFRKREKQSSVEESIGEFMAQNGLQMPDIPIFVEDEEGDQTDSDSVLSV